VFKVEGTEQPSDTLARLGTCLPEHVAYVGRELSEAKADPR
jgi:hypothetical protein